MKVHFDPYCEEYGPDSDIAPCGTVIGEDYRSSSRWSDVTCKRCLKRRKKAQAEFKETEAIIVEQMGDMTEFMQGKGNKV